MHHAQPHLRQRTVPASIARAVVDCTLTGKVDQLKEYALGVDVFDRGTAFDPRVDTIVRVQARRLRSKLEEYYRSEGDRAELVIELGKGRYVPEFRSPPAGSDDIRSCHRDPLQPPRSADADSRSFREQRSGASGRRSWSLPATGLLFGATLLTVLGTLAFRADDGGGGSRTDRDGQVAPVDTDRREANTVAIAVFENRSGDATLDALGHLAAERIIRTVTDVEGVHVVPHPVRVLAGVGITPTSDVGAVGAALFVTGTYYLHDGSLQLQAQVLEPRTGRLMHGTTPIRAEPSRTDEALRRLEEQLAGAIAIHFDEFFGGLDVVAHPPTIHAYRDYRAGLEVFHSDYGRAVRHLERARRRAPRFLLPLVILHFAHGNLGEMARAESALARMEEQLDQLGSAERLIVEFLRADWEGRRAEALGILEDLERLVPASLLVNHNLVQLSVMMNRPRAAIAAYRRQPVVERRLRHSIGTYRYDWVIQALHVLGEHTSELQQIEEAQLYAPGRLRFVEAEACALVGLGRIADVSRVIERSLSIPPAAGSPRTPGDLMEHTARELRAHGYREESRALAARAVEWYTTRPDDQSAGTRHREMLGSALYLAERWSEAEAVFASLAAEHPGEAPYVGYLGRIAARTGQVARARALSTRLERMRVGRFEPPASYWQSAIAALLGERSRAVDLLRDAFTKGLWHGVFVHNDPDFELLREYGPHRQLVAPSG